MSVTTTIKEHGFLVRAEEGKFVKDVDGSQISVTDVLSLARHCDYTTADQAAQRLRRRGFPWALVTDHLGQPVTAEVLRTALEAERAANMPSKPALPKNLRELQNISAAESKRRYKDEPEFRERVDKLYSAGR